MLRRFVYSVLVIVLHGGLCSRAAAQGGFQVRHDAFGQGHSRSCFGFEQSSDGSFVLFGNGMYYNWDDSLLYSSVVSAERFSTNGSFLNEDTVLVPLIATYVGWSNCSTKLPDGRIVVSGGFSVDPDTNRIAIYWFSPDGTALDHVTILLNSRSWIAYQHKNTPDGGFILTGVTDATGVQDIFLLKTDSLGTVQWWQTYGHPTWLDYATSVELAPDGGYYIGGIYQQIPGGGGQYVQWVLHTDSLGGLIWEYLGGAPSYDAANAAVLSTADGNMVYAAAKFVGGPDQGQKPEMVKMDVDGNVLWEKTYGDSVFATGFFSVAEVPVNGDLIACGQKWFQTDGGFAYRKGILVRANSEGDSLWMREYVYYDSLMNDGQGLFRDVQPTADGGFVAVGQTAGSISGNNPPGLSQDVWVVKVDSLGCIIPGCDDFSTVITVQATNLRDALAVYPNPARESTTVNVALSAGSSLVADLRLRLVSAQGQEVLVQRAAIGENQLSLHELAGGIYYLHLTSGTTLLSGTKLVVE